MTQRGSACAVQGSCPQQPSRGKTRKRSPHSGLKVSPPFAGGAAVTHVQKSCRPMQQLRAGRLREAWGWGAVLQYQPRNSPWRCVLMSPRGQEKVLVVEVYPSQLWKKTQRNVMVTWRQQNNTRHFSEENGPTNSWVDKVVNEDGEVALTDRHNF